MNLSNINWGEALAFAILGLVFFTAYLLLPIAMRKRGAAFALAILAAFCLLPSAFALEFVQGIYIDGSTNTFTVGGTNICRSTVNPSATNTYNLLILTVGSGNTQPNTNQWPAQPLVSAYGLNHRILCLSGQVQCSAANNGLETIRIAVSSNPSTNWITGFCTLTVTCNGTTPVNWSTNLDTFAFPYVALQTLENTNLTVTLTNTIQQPVDKSGSGQL